MTEESRLLVHKPLQAYQGEIAQQLQLRAAAQLEPKGTQHSRDPASDRALIADSLTRGFRPGAQPEQEVKSL